MGVSRDQVGALTDTDGAAFFRKSGENISDGEGLTTLRDGRFAVFFERSSKILIYGDNSNPTRIDLPPNVNALTENRGVEALALDLEGRLIAIPEPVPKQAPGVPVWRQTENGWDIIGHINRSLGFQPVGADIGPGGRLYVLERAFPLVGFQSQIRAFLPNGFDPEGDVIWTTPLRAFDNLEGLSVWEDGDGPLRFTMISDDNNLDIQETQFVEFRLTD